MHLKVQDPEHILQNSPTHAPESPGYQTHPADLPYPWPESPGSPHILQTCPTHVSAKPRLQESVYDIRPSTAAITGYVIGLRTLSADSFPLIFKWQFDN